MSQLLGDAGDPVRAFCQDVERFQRGERIVGGNRNHSTTDNDDTKKEAAITALSQGQRQKISDPVAEERRKTEQREQEKLLKQPPKSFVNQKSQIQPPAGISPMNSAGNPNPSVAAPDASTKKNKSAASSKQKSAKASKSVAVAPVKKMEPKPTKPRPPQKGTANIVCGCFGGKHKPLTNCLHCGRIACEREGYGYCGFCGFLMEPVEYNSSRSGVESSVANISKAQLHKERLLKFDREFTKRTVIYDDQADYFSNKTSGWLTENEQNDAAEQDEAKRKEMHERKKQTLNITF